MASQSAESAAEKGQIRQESTPSSPTDLTRRVTFEETKKPSFFSPDKNPIMQFEKKYELLSHVRSFIKEKNLELYSIEITKGAVLARYTQNLQRENVDEEEVCKTLARITGEHEELSSDTRGAIAALKQEVMNRWTQSFWMYFLAALCAASAIVQGMDQSAVNGAQTYYFLEFGITDVWMKGFINGSPYVFAALIGCWMTRWLNNLAGRRGCIGICCFFTALASIWQAVSPNVGSLIAARALLGLAIGAKSTTTPVYASESAPTRIRGSLTMMWQMWTAFGIMCGFATSLAYAGVQSSAVPGLNWRLMLGTNAIFPSLVCVLVWFCPESPRWYMQRNRYSDAFKSLCRLRTNPVLAGRDLYMIHLGLQRDELLSGGQKKGLLDLFRGRRNQNAARSSFFVMYMQQFCGVNVVAYYSTEIFVNAGWSMTRALLASFGAGAINWVFALPAFYTIDTFGRRNLLLVSFPLMGLCLLLTGAAFFIQTLAARTGLVACGIYLFMICYSPGEGPVPFTYSAEAFPMDVRDWGMSFATSVCWFFNFILAFSWPGLVRAFTPSGAFFYYAAWCFAAFFYTYFFLQETKGRSLEQLNIVFNMPVMEHARHYRDKIFWYWAKYIRRVPVVAFKQLFDDAEHMEELPRRESVESSPV